jgi:hypothetical protein
VGSASCRIFSTASSNWPDDVRATTGAGVPVNTAIERDYIEPSIAINVAQFTKIYQFILCNKS